MAEVAVKVGKQTKWISGLTEKTTCRVSGSRRFMSWTPVVQNLLGTGFLSRLLAQYAENKTIILN